MVEKRIILAMALSLMVVFLWSKFLPKTYLSEKKTVTTQTLQAIPAPVAPNIVVLSEPPESALQKLSFPGVETVFVSSQATIKETLFQDYRLGKLILKSGFLLGSPEMVFVAGPSSPQEANFTYEDKDKRIDKRFLFSNSKYSIGLEIKIENMSNLPLSLDLPIILGILDSVADPVGARFQDVTMVSQEKIEHPHPRKETSLSGIKF